MFKLSLAITETIFQFKLMRRDLILKRILGGGSLDIPCKMGRLKSKQRLCLDCQE
jgi:hypothetical protein